MSLSPSPVLLEFKNPDGLTPTLHTDKGKVSIPPTCIILVGPIGLFANFISQVDRAVAKYINYMAWTATGRSVDMSAGIKIEDVDVLWSQNLAVTRTPVTEQNFEAVWMALLLGRPEGVLYVTLKVGMLSVEGCYLR